LLQSVISDLFAGFQYLVINFFIRRF